MRNSQSVQKRYSIYILHRIEPSHYGFLGLMDLTDDSESDSEQVADTMYCYRLEQVHGFEWSVLRDIIDCHTKVQQIVRNSIYCFK